MEIEKLILHNIKNFPDKNTFDFSDSHAINTISGKNGAGKSTIFECITFVQRAYFMNQLKSNFTIPSELKRVEGTLEKNLYFYFNSEGSYIELFFHTDKNKDKLEDNKSNQVKIKLFPKNLNDQKVNWDIEIQGRNIIKKFWNLKDPKNLIIYLESDKHVEEEDKTFSKLEINSKETDISSVVKLILDPMNAFQYMYDQLINDYMHQRLVPDDPPKDMYFYLTKSLFQYLMPNIEFVKFSPNHVQGQYVALAKNDNSSLYDIRNFSSGEKFLFYLLLFLNYIKSVGTLIIDEPENHLHEELLCQLVETFKQIVTRESYTNYIENKIDEDIEALTKKVKENLEEEYKNFILNKVYLITHSKGLIYYNFDIGNNYILSNGLKKIDESFEKELREVGVSSIYEKVLFVEGKLEADLLESFLSPHNIMVEQLDNCTEIETAFKNVMHIKEQGYIKDSQFVFLIDRDTKDSDYIKRIKEDNEEKFKTYFMVLDRHEIENYLLEPKIFKEVLEDCTNNTDYDIPEEEKIEEVMYKKANELRKKVAQKHLNRLIREKIDIFKNSKIDDDKIKIDSTDNYKSYIQDKANEFKAKFENLEDLYEPMRQKYYDDQNWEENWKRLCYGSGVFGKTSKYFSDVINVNGTFLKEHIKGWVKNKKLRNEDFKLFELIEDILRKFDIDK